MFKTRSDTIGPVTFESRALITSKKSKLRRSLEEAADMRSSDLQTVGRISSHGGSFRSAAFDQPVRYIYRWQRGFVRDRGNRHQASCDESDRAFS